MSQMTAAPRAGTRTPHRPPAAGPGLRVVTGKPAVRPGAAFAVLCAVLLAAGLVGLLLLNTALGGGSYAVHALESTSGRLADTQDALTQSLSRQQSPAQLAARAAGMGMIPADSAAFLRLSDGAVVGVASKATKAKVFTVVTAPTPAPVTPKAATAPATTSKVAPPGAVATTAEPGRKQAATPKTRTKQTTKKTTQPTTKPR